MKNKLFCMAGRAVIASIAVMAMLVAALPTAGANGEGDLNIPAGDDQWKVADAGFDLSGTPIPADFFAPGSEPFGGVIICGPGLGDSPDTIIKRGGDINLPPPPSEDTIPIELIELQLVSCQPIVVNHNDGNHQLWNVEVNLPPTPLIPPSPGQMTVTRTHDHGGTFDSQLPVQPRFIFTPVEGGVITEPGTGEGGTEPGSGEGGQLFEPGSGFIVEAEQQQVIFEPIFDFSALEVPWFVCPNTEADFCPDDLPLLDENSWMNLIPNPPLPPLDCKHPAAKKIMDAADKIASSKSPKAQEIVDYLRGIAETVETILDGIDNLPDVPIGCPELQ